MLRLSAFSLALACCAPLFASDIKVSGVVVDAAGKPVGNAEISAWWSHWKGELKADGGVKSNADGQFSVDVEVEGSTPPALLAFSSDRKTGGYVVLGKEAAQKVTLKLETLVNVTGRFDCPDMGIALESTIQGTLRFLPSASPIMQCGSETKEFKLALPPGNYAFDNETTDTLARDYPFDVLAGQPEMDLGIVNLDPTPIARAYKKTPPKLTLTGVRNGPENLTLEALKGKHVLVIFWAFWCTPCVQGAIPEAMDFYEKHPELRDKYVILAVHEPGVAKTWEEYDAKGKSVIEKVWKGRVPKFMQAIDASGTTFKDYAIKLLPTDMLIAPDGTVVPHGSLPNLKKALGVEEK